MLKKQKNNHQIGAKKVRILTIFALAFMLIQLLCRFLFGSSSYSFFIEFSDASGIQVGTPIRMRGICIGFVQSVKLKFNSVLVIVKMESGKVVIPACSLIETTQTGLLNEPVIDVIPFSNLVVNDSPEYSPLSSLCNSSVIICNNAYVIGDRGLNYDDLIRSATRISQRFDDPRFFNIFYVFLQTGIEATDIAMELLRFIADAVYVDESRL